MNVGMQQENLTLLDVSIGVSQVSLPIPE